MQIFAINYMQWLFKKLPNFHSFRQLATMKHIDAILCDLDTSCAIGDLVYTLKLLAYTFPTPPSILNRLESQEIITEESLRKKYQKQYDTFMNKVSSQFFSLSPIASISFLDLQYLLITGWRIIYYLL